MPNSKRRLMEAVLASGVLSVTVPAESDELKPPLFGWPSAPAASSSVVPCTFTAGPPPHSAGFATTTDKELRGRRSAAHAVPASPHVLPAGSTKASDGKVVMSTTRKRRRVML